MYNILIVDDERIERNGIIMLLKRLSINAGIVEAANGKEAYEYLCSDEAEHIDILLTDVKNWTGFCISCIKHQNVFLKMLHLSS